MSHYRVGRTYYVEVEAESAEEADAKAWTEVWEKNGLCLVDDDAQIADLPEAWSVELLDSAEG